MNEQPGPENSPVQEPPRFAGEPQDVLYDEQGRQISGDTPAAAAYQKQPGPQFVHLSRAADPQKPILSDEHQARHEDSCQRYPQLNISEAEYVISSVRRHPIGMFAPVGIALFLVVIITSFLFLLPSIVNYIGITDHVNYGLFWLGGLFVIAIIALSAYLAVWVYKANQFYLTNESVIEEIQTGLFGHHEQTVSLANIEDASYDQRGIMQTMFDYGSIRLSTEGDETTYVFDYVADPKQQISVLNNAVESFKNGRPVNGS